MTKRQHRASKECWCHPVSAGTVDGYQVWKHKDGPKTFLMSEERRDLSLKEARKLFGVRLRGLRDGAGMTRGTLADELGAGENYIYTLEHGLGSPGIGLLQRLGRVFDVSVDELLTDDSGAEILFPKRGDGR